MRPAPRASDLAAVAATSCAAIALQIALTRVLSITLWHHFAYLVIGVALLGFGAAGAWLAGQPAPAESEAGLHATLSRRARVAAVGSLVAVLAALVIRPNALALFSDPSAGVSLALLMVLLAVPFAGAGAVIGTALSAWRAHPGRVYAADLAGAGVGALVYASLVERVGALGVIAAAVGLIAMAAILLSRSAPRGDQIATALVALGLVAATGLLEKEDAWIAPAPTKELAILARGDVPSWVDHRAWTAHGRVDVSHVIDAPPLVAGEVGPPLSLVHIRFVTQDGAAPTSLHQVVRDPAELDFLPRATTAAVWALRGATFGPRAPAERRGESLVIGVGGGIDLMMALGHGVRRVTGVEINPAIAELTRSRFADFVGHVAERRDVAIHVDDGRSFIRAARDRFDVIQLAGVDTFTALASGAYSLAEAYLYTREAFDDYFAHLAPGGCLSISRLFLEPPRETLRLAVTAAEALDARGSLEPWRHLAVVRGRLWGTMLACESPINAEALERLRAFVKANGFALAFDPGVTDTTERRPYAIPFRRALVGGASAREKYIDDYPFRISPARDEAPFFFDYFRWRSLGRVADLKSESIYSTPVPVGHGVQLLSLLVTTLIAALAILRPARRLAARSSAGDRKSTGRYFACLGAAYLLVEVACIQRLTFFLGHPSHALGVVLSGLLIASGLGAALSPRLGPRYREKLALVLPLALLLAGAVSWLALPALVGQGFGARLVLSLALIAPLGVAMGMPFPRGLAEIDARAVQVELGPSSAGLVAWAFAVNAFATVIAASLAPLLAEQTGFSSLFAIAAVLYLAAFRMRPESPAPATGSNAAR